MELLFKIMDKAYNHNYYSTTSDKVGSQKATQDYSHTNCRSRFGGRRGLLLYLLIKVHVGDSIRWFGE